MCNSISLKSALFYETPVRHPKLFFRLSGLSPFMGDTDLETMANVTIAEYDYEDEAFDNISADAKDLIKKLIVRPEKRLTAPEALKHKWLRTHTGKKAADKATLKKLNVANMKKFQKSEKLKQVALMAIAVQTDPNEVQELKKIFQELDKDGNGAVSLQELQGGLGERENGAELLAILQAADTDGNGVINYTGKDTI